MKPTPSRPCRSALFLACLGLLGALPTAAPTRAGPAPTTRPSVWICPPAMHNGRQLRELFEHPDQWRETRSLVDVLGYTDLNFNRQFTDDQLRAWLPQLGRWHVKLGLEVGAIKPWGKTADKIFAVERPMWRRIERLGAPIYAVAMDEPLCCARKEINESDDYAVRETASYIALVRRDFPNARIGDIEPYPFIALPDQTHWIDALQSRLAAMHVRGLDFYRLDVNWIEFTVFDRGNWPEVRKLERFCREKKLPFSLIYWASGYPGLEKRKLADDSTWYTSVMQQGYDYAMVDGRPDEYVVESWIDAPSTCLPESAEFTFTRSVRDFARKFAPRGTSAPSGTSVQRGSADR